MICVLFTGSPLAPTLGWHEGVGFCTAVVSALPLGEAPPLAPTLGELAVRQDWLRGG